MTESGQSRAPTFTPADASRLSELPATRLADSTMLRWASLHVERYAERPLARPFELAAASNPVIVLVTSGHYLIQSLSGSTWRHTVYGPGSIGITAPGNPSTLQWKALSSAPLESVHIQLDPALLRDIAEQNDRGDAELVPDALRLDHPELVAACRSVAWGLREQAPPLYADAAAVVLATHLVHSKVRPSTGGLDRRTLRRVVEFLHDHLSSGVTLDELSAVAGLSKHHLVRQFKVSVGVPPQRYLTKLRMERAAELLGGTPLTVQSIATSCGYASVSRFATAFAARFGQTPGRYRSDLRR